MRSKRIYKIARLALVLSVACATLFGNSIAKAAFVSPGQPTGHVNDFANVIDSGQRQTLESELSVFEKETTTQISVATVTSLNGEEIETYANEIFREWGVGTKMNNGVLLLIAPNEKKVRIEIGYGLEGALTDLQSSRIINEIIIPQFKAKNYGQGATLGAEAIMKAVKGEDFGTSYTAPATNTFWNSVFNNAGGVIVFGIIIIQWLAAILGRSKSWWFGGVLGGAVGIVISLFYGLLFTGLISIVILIPLGLLFDFIVSSNYSKAKRTGTIVPWFFGGGGSGGGSSFGGGGFGGFGGGSSGGGGASGGW